LEEKLVVLDLGFSVGWVVGRDELGLRDDEKFERLSFDKDEFEEYGDRLIDI